MQKVLYMVGGLAQRVFAKSYCHDGCCSGPSGVGRLVARAYGMGAWDAWDREVSRYVVRPVYKLGTRAMMRGLERDRLGFGGAAWMVAPLHFDDIPF